MIRDPVAEFGALIEEVKFASDSPLEESGFEPSVPRKEPHANAFGGYVIGSLDSHRHLVSEAGRAAKAWTTTGSGVRTWMRAHWNTKLPPMSRLSP